MTAGLTGLSLAEARDGLAKGAFSSRQLTQAHLDAIQAARSLNMFISELPDHALAAAEASDRRRAKGAAGAMEGIPIAKSYARIRRAIA